jgi:outer membrane receptor protein involved in Fe transport
MLGDAIASPLNQFLRKFPAAEFRFRSNLIEDGAIMNIFKYQHDRPSLFGIFAALTVALAFAVSANAQEADDPGDAYGTIEEIIVTGTAGGGELRKFDASFSITTTSNEEINRFSPKSTADLFKLVPGVWAESSSGVSGANVFVRGFAAAGDAPYVTVHVNGAPIYPPPTLSFLENSTLFRIDETIQRMEALRGGPNPVLSNGQPGVTTNFILREGSEETEGLVKFTTSDYDLRRFDGYISGEIADEFYYMIGGYITSSPGIRDSQFNSDEGNQITINLTKDLELGSVNVFHRNTDDSGTWYLPAALSVPGVDNEYNQIGTMNRQRQIRVGPNDEPRTLDLGEGRGWDGSITGAIVVLDVTDNWQLTNRASYTSGNADTLGLVPQSSPVQISALRADPTLDPAAVIIGPIEGSVSGRAIADSEFIQQFGAWEVRKDLEAFVNDLSLERNWDRGTVTVGYYAANASSDDLWTLGNQQYEVIQAGGEVVTGIECNDPAVDGCGGGFDLDQVGDVTTNALYAATTFDVGDRLTFDVGVRVENHDVEMSADFGQDGSIDLTVSADETETSWTAAGNYRFTDTFAAFLRLNQGKKMPTFNDYRDNSAAFADGDSLIRDVEQIELGAKWVTDYLSVYATAFYTTEDPTIFVAMAGTTPGVISTTETTGIEIDGNWATDLGFDLNLNATFQSAEFDGGPNAGNTVPRQPDWQARLTPSYAFEIGTDVEGTVYGTLTVVDDRFSDSGNTVVLEGYEKLDLGVLLRVNERLTFQLAGDNVTDEDALTEGDPRDPLLANGRFILPRSFRFSIGYEF